LVIPNKKAMLEVGHAQTAVPSIEQKVLLKPKKGDIP